MRITNVSAQAGFKLLITTNDGRTGVIDISPYLDLEAFAELSNDSEFMKIRNGGYFVEWDCGADLSADTIEARMVEKDC